MINVRTATQDDVHAICSLGVVTPEFSVSDTTVAFWPRNIIENIVSSNAAIVLVAEDEGSICGFIIANCNASFQKVIIENICVRPEIRESGVGSALLRQLLRQASDAGFEYITTLVSTDSSAKFYTQAGFGPGGQFQWYDKVLTENFKKSAR